MPRWRRWILWVLFLLLAITVALNLDETGGAVAVMVQAEGTWILAAAILLVSRYIVDAVLIRAVLAIAGVSGRLWELVPVIYASLFANLAGIAASGALLVDDAARRGQSPARATAGILLALASDYVGFLFFLIPSLVYLGLAGALEAYQMVFAAAFLVYMLATAGPLLLSVARPQALHRILRWVHGAANFLACRLIHRPILGGDWAKRNTASFGAAAAAALAAPRRAVAALAIAVSFRGIELLGAYFLFPAFRLRLDPLGVVAAYAIGTLFWIVGVTPQGIGVVESTMALTLMSLGLPVSGALAVALAYRGLSFWLPLLLGAALAPRVPSLRR